MYGGRWCVRVCVWWKVVCEGVCMVEGGVCG